MSEAAATTGHGHEAETDSKPKAQATPFGELPMAVKAIGLVGLPGILMVLWFWFSYKPDQDAKRDIERSNAQTLFQMGQSIQMLVEQDRRRENAHNEMIRSQQEMMRIQQEQLGILKQIMVDQKRGAWNDPAKPNGPAAAILQPPN